MKAQIIGITVLWWAQGLIMLGLNADFSCGQDSALGFSERSVPVRDLKKADVAGAYVGYAGNEFFFYRLDLNLDRESRFTVVPNPLIKGKAPKPLVYRIREWSLGDHRVSLAGVSESAMFPSIRIEGKVSASKSLKIAISGNVPGGEGSAVLFSEANLENSMLAASKALQEYGKGEK